MALVPSIEALSDPEYEVISDACVATRGPVLSVKLYFRKSPGAVKTLALDEGSRTSAALARIMLAERYGVEPRIERFTLDSRIEETTADAVLMIGDRAILPPTIPFVEEWDLGEEWLRWTGLPFVFALWVGRRDVELGRVEHALALLAIAAWLRFRPLPDANRASCTCPSTWSKAICATICIL